jgi:hypothetical protein
MDCEKFEAALMDELYGELDELTSAAMKRHAATCSRCGGLLSGLSATRQLAAIPAVEPPPGLEERILAAARDAQKVTPIGRRAAQVVSLAGRWAMRPQTAMAAVFLVMIGTSVLLLTSRSARAPLSASVTVTEQGSPAPDVPLAQAPALAAASAAPDPSPTSVAGDRGVVASAPPPPAAYAQLDSPREEQLARRARPAPAATTAPKDDEDGINAYHSVPPAAAAAPIGANGAGGGVGGELGGPGGTDKKVTSPMTAAIQTYQAGRYEDAAKAFDALAPANPSADLWAARAVRESKGCRSALSRFDRAAQRGAGSPTGWDALLEGGLCYRAIGDFGNARSRLSALLAVDSHKDRARAELDRMNQMQAGQASGGSAGAAKAAAPSPAPAPPASRPPAASATAVDQSQ